MSLPRHNLQRYTKINEFPDRMFSHFQPFLHSLPHFFRPVVPRIVSGFKNNRHFCTGNFRYIYHKNQIETSQHAQSHNSYKEMQQYVVV